MNFFANWTSVNTYILWFSVKLLVLITLATVSCISWSSIKLILHGVLWHTSLQVLYNIQWLKDINFEVNSAMFRANQEIKMTLMDRPTEESRGKQKKLMKMKKKTNKMKSGMKSDPSCWKIVNFVRVCVKIFIPPKLVASEWPYSGSSSGFSVIGSSEGVPQLTNLSWHSQWLSLEMRIS